MIKVNLTTLAAVEMPLPDYLHGLTPESLENLNWTDPALGEVGHGYFEVTNYTEAQFDDTTHYVASHTYEVDPTTMQITAHPVIDALTPSEVESKQAAKAALLEQARLSKNASINASRLTANLGSFTYLDKQIACDTLSRSDIDATNGYISLFGVLHPNWPGGWKAVDNTYVPITTVDDWKAFYTAMVNQGQSNFAKAQSLKSTLASATTIEAINAINW